MGKKERVVDALWRSDALLYSFGSSSSTFHISGAITWLAATRRPVAQRTRARLSRQGRPQHVLVNSQFRFMLYRGNKEMGLSVLRVFRKACLSLPQLDMRSLVNSRAVLVNAPLRDGARWLQSRGFIAGVLQEEGNNTVSGDVRDGQVAYGGAVVRVRPKVLPLKIRW